MCFEGSSLFRLCLGKPRAQAGPRPDGCREGTCHHTASAPRGRWNPGGTGAGVPLKPAPFLCWETLFPVLNLGESQVCFVKGGGIPLAAPPESLHLSRSEPPFVQELFGGELHACICPGQERELQVVLELGGVASSISPRLNFLACLGTHWQALR